MAVRVDMTLRGPREIAAALTGLALVNVAQVRGGLPWPGLYSGRWRYRREPDTQDTWRTMADLMRRPNGYADCEDLTAARLAELWLGKDRRARPFVKRVRPGLLHVLVKRGNGSLEDPSRRLGMGREDG